MLAAAAIFAISFAIAAMLLMPRAGAIIFYAAAAMPRFRFFQLFRF